MVEVPAAVPGIDPLRLLHVPEGNWPVVVRPSVFSAPVERKFTPNAAVGGAVQLGEPHPQQHLLVHPRRGYPQIRSPRL